MAVEYLITLAASLLIFPLFWHKRFFAGLQWNAPAALRRFWPLMAAACACFVLAMVDELLLPGPENAPIEKLFDTRMAAWFLFAFAVTFAPLFEEIVFRGFLLPTLCTACDWFGEKASGSPAPPLLSLIHIFRAQASALKIDICNRSQSARNRFRAAIPPVPANRCV